MCNTVSYSLVLVLIVSQKKSTVLFNIFDHWIFVLQKTIKKKWHMYL